MLLWAIKARYFFLVDKSFSGYLFAASFANRFKILLKFQGKSLVVLEKFVEVVTAKPGCNAVF